MVAMLETEPVCVADAKHEASAPRLEAPTQRPGELTDLQWQRIVPLLPCRKSTGRRRSTSLRDVVVAINLHWQTGCPWRRLPEDLPPWPTVYTYFRRWLKDGTLRQMRAILNPPRLSDVAPTVRQTRRPSGRLNPNRERSKKSSLRAISPRRAEVTLPEKHPHVSSARRV